MSPKEKAEAKIAADYFLTPGRGGIVIWVRRDTMEPHMSFRLKDPPPEIIELVAMLGSIRHALNIMTDHVAEKEGIPSDVMRRMVDVAADECAKHLKKDVSV